MNEDLKMIPRRIHELREILDITAEHMAANVGVRVDDYEKYESGELDIPISTLYEIAAELGVDFTVLLTGDTPRMQDQCVVRADEGVSVDRYKGYAFSSLAYNYIGRVMEPMLVTLDKSEGIPSMVIHGGQEFNYVISGSVKVTVGKKCHILNQGDSIYFNPQLPHGQEAATDKAVFLTVINE